MFTSAAGVFRTRQAVADLTACIDMGNRSAFGRIVLQGGGLNRLSTVLDERGGRFDFPRDTRIYGEVMLAAALPDDDFPAFTSATALLLLDRILGGDGEDNLFWNWDAFADHYRLADPPVRAALMNGFRVGAERGVVSLGTPVDPDDCLTDGREAVLRALGVYPVADALLGDTDAEEAGRLWALHSRNRLSDPEQRAFRYLYERPQSMSPPFPETVPLIPWA